MRHYLLLGAGFSRNWGGWLAAEAFEYLLGCSEITSNSQLQALLWKHQSNGGFEHALAEIQSNFIREPASIRISIYRIMYRFFGQVWNHKIQNIASGIRP